VDSARTNEKILHGWMATTTPSISTEITARYFASATLRVA
jgi:hypothetical protein